VLVSGLSEVVGAIDVSPIERGWEGLSVQVSVWSWSLDKLLLGFSDGASFLCEEPALGSLPPGAFNSLSLALGARVLLVAGPSVDWDGERALLFNTDVVGTSDNLEVTGVTPVSTPRVSDNPVFGAVFNTVTDNGNSMIDGVRGGVNVDDGTIVVQDVSSIDTAGNWTSLVKLVQDSGLRVREVAKFIDSVVVPFLRDPAAVRWVAVSADDIFGAAETVGVTTGLVRRAGFI
jgi:hypothetical protein